MASSPDDLKRDEIAKLKRSLAVAKQLLKEKNQLLDDRLCRLDGERKRAQEAESERAKLKDYLLIADGDIEIHQSRAAHYESRCEALTTALRDIDGWRHDRLGAHPSQSPADEAFDRGARMALYRCSERARAAIAASGAEPTGREEALSYTDLCRLSRLFNERADLSINSPDYRINEWLKAQLVRAYQSIARLARSSDP